MKLQKRFHDQVERQSIDTPDGAFLRTVQRAKAAGLPLMSMIDDRCDTMFNHRQQRLLLNELRQILDSPDLLGDAQPIVGELYDAVEEMLHTGGCLMLVPDRRPT
ncbi:MAG: hypothetical protein M3400_13335 [Actinomycetota bacterium]|nr:hypothetical protein [Actinomycetota bacterium]